MKHFILTDDHILLLQRAYIGWEDCEYGAPAIDCKSPYGNSAVELDMAEILGIEIIRDQYGELSETQVELFREMHKETKIELQIILRTKSFLPGKYIADDYDTNWRLESDN